MHVRKMCSDCRRNLFTYNAAISAFAKGLQWQPALYLLRELQQANVTTYNVAINACDKDVQ